MDGPAGPSPFSSATDPAMERLQDSSDSCQNCQCDKTQGEVKVRSKRYGRGAVESGKSDLSLVCSNKTFSFRDKNLGAIPEYNSKA